MRTDNINGARGKRREVEWVIIVQGLRETAAAVCAVMIICSAASMLVPGEKFERVIKLVLAGVMLVTIAQGIYGIDLSFVSQAFQSHTGSVQSEFSDRVTDYAGEVVEDTAGRLLYQRFETLGIECENISFDINTYESGSISIDRVVLVIPDEGMHGSAREAVKQMLGGDMEVKIVREE